MSLLLLITVAGLLFLSSKYLESKIDIMSNYESEIGEHPFPRSSKAIEALATLRGSECGVEFAEAFMIMKEVKK